MRQIIATIKGMSPLVQSRYHQAPRLDKELAEDYEKRTWRERMHTMPDGRVFIPPLAFKNCLSDAAQFLSVQIPGRGKARFTKHFQAGVLVLDPLLLPVKKDEVKPLVLYVPSDGRRGGSKRVLKYFPQIDEWGGEVTFYILDDTITKNVFDYHLSEAGKFIGIGAFRPRNNGFNGRFKVLSTEEIAGD